VICKITVGVHTKGADYQSVAYELLCFKININKKAIIFSVLYGCLTVKCCFLSRIYNPTLFNYSSLNYVQAYYLTVYDHNEY